MDVKERREIPIKPVALKLGLAFVISLGGVVYTYIRIKGHKPKSKPSQPSAGNGSQVDSRIESGELRDDDHPLQSPSLRKVSSQNSTSDCSSHGDRDSFLLPEFNDLVKECNMSVTMDNACPRKSGDDEQEREIRRLRNRVEILQEKERNLELQLLEYYGIKEQETAVVELQNQLRINTMEAKLYDLKIESLLLDNRRLEAQVADYANASTELEAAKAKVKMLKKKLKFEGERSREQILKLQDRVMKQQEQEKKAAEMDQDLKIQQQERNELKTELDEIKERNHDLKLENSDLTQKLEYVRMIATNAINSEEVHELKQESRRLKKQIEESRKEIEQLQAGRCTDLEELAYLRWVNACLRYELRNYHSGDGKIVGRDLSKTLSPKSENKAKKLILELAYKEGPAEKVMMDANYTDSDQWSPSQASCVTDDLPAIDPPAANKTNKTKLFAKLRKLVLGKSSGSGRTQGRASPLDLDEIPARFSCDFPSGFSLDVESGNDDLMKSSRTSSMASSRRSLDIPRSYSRGLKSITRENSNGSSSTLTRIDSLTEYENDWSPSVIQPNLDSPNTAKDLLKFAEALKNQKSFRSTVSSDSG